MKYICIVCNATLKEAPTKKWWQKISSNKGVCYECILKLAKNVLFSMEHYNKEQNI